MLLSTFVPLDLSPSTTQDIVACASILLYFAKFKFYFDGETAYFCKIPVIILYTCKLPAPSSYFHNLLKSAVQVVQMGHLFQLTWGIRSPEYLLLTVMDGSSIALVRYSLEYIHAVGTCYQMYL